MTVLRDQMCWCFEGVSDRLRINVAKKALMTNSTEYEMEITFQRVQRLFRIFHSITTVYSLWMLGFVFVGGYCWPNHLN